MLKRKFHQDKAKNDKTFEEWRADFLRDFHPRYKK